MKKYRLSSIISFFVILMLLVGCGKATAPQEAASNNGNGKIPTSEEKIPPTSNPAASSTSPALSLRNYPQVILGKNNWLFYGEPMNKLIRDGPLTDEQIQRIVTELVAITNSLKQKGVYFLFILAPDKQLIYPEFMPEKYLDDGPLLAYERMSQALSAAGINFIDAKPILEQRKKETDYRLYYLRDNRWSPFGNYLMTQEIMARLSENFPVPKYELVSVDTPLDRVVTGEVGNDLNDMLQSLTPWYERGAPEPVYNFSGAEGAPSILWYGDCFSAPLTEFVQGSWPNKINYVSLWGNYGLPPSLRGDLEKRLDGEKIVIFEVDEHYRQDLSRTFVPALPKVDSSWSLTYNWKADSFLNGWAPGGEYNIQTTNDAILVTVEDQSQPVSFYSTANLLITTTRKHYLVITLISPAAAGVLVDFSKTTMGDYSFEGRRGQHITKGDNTLIFEFPKTDARSPIKSIRIYLGEVPGIYSISEVAIYSGST